MKIFNKSLKNLLTLGIVGVTLFGSGCESALEIDPRQSIDAGIALETRGGITAAINSVYARLRSADNYGRALIVDADALADLGVATGNSGRQINQARNQFNTHINNWQNSYYAINEINLILEAIPNLVETPPVSEDEANSWNGQMKFLRALYYFDLVKVYAYMPGAVVDQLNKGGIPVVLEGVISTELALTRLPARETIDAVYSQIYADLNDAISLLSNSSNPYYASQGAAYGLLSRVALYRKDYATAVSAATQALASNSGVILSGNAYVAGWRSESNPESMFEVRFFNATEGVGGVNESLQSSTTSIIDLGNPQSQGGWGDFVPNALLLEQIGVSASGSGSDPRAYTVTRGADIRAELYAVGNGRGSGPKLEVTKYMGKSGVPYVDNAPVLRKSEVLLNRAEAQTYAGAALNLDAALADLNTFRAARGLDAFVSSDADEIREEILLQRKIELAFEGQRYFDLKRLGRDIIKPQGDVAFTDIRILAPLPQREIDGNPNLVQNEGY
ncbi:SusD family protein [Algoriphagus locisalis]|uniref:SusD family protein n=1 Tax=Algoriphagus locisalis TaxID=305507 RepID=A0A1I6ZP71_9BACT|nr:RagB/SusD family nutrient uptake outer membrane protein [Algoriphagus locisalis]SFT64506.1 SusD family protein [Algoriphagus locisalis]